jgi:hypothetical protein
MMSKSQKAKARKGKKPPKVGCGVPSEPQSSRALNSWSQICVAQQLLSLKQPNPTSNWVQLDVSKDVPAAKPPDIKFGYRSPTPLRDMYCRTLGAGSTGSVTTHAELGLIVTDFFDYNVVPAFGTTPLPVTNYFWNVDQNLFENSAAAPILDNELTFCRVRKIMVYVLPAKGFEIGSGSGPNTNNAQGMFTVQAQVPGVSGSNADAALATNTQVTNVLPQIDTFWKKVLTVDYDQTFKSGVVRPYFDATGVQASAQCLFQMAVVDPTDGLPYLNNTDDNLVIRVKVSIHVDQPISVIQRASLRVFKNESFATPSTVGSSGDPFATTEAEYVQTDIRSVLNKFR